MEKGKNVERRQVKATSFIFEALHGILFRKQEFSASRVRILHGTGTGALRVAVRRYLQSTLDVESFHDEDVRFGGAGITVVNLR